MPKNATVCLTAFGIYIFGQFNQLGAMMMPIVLFNITKTMTNIIVAEEDKLRNIVQEEVTKLFSMKQEVKQK